MVLTPEQPAYRPKLEWSLLAPTKPTLVSSSWRLPVKVPPGRENFNVALRARLNASSVQTDVEEEIKNSYMQSRVVLYSDYVGAQGLHTC